MNAPTTTTHYPGEELRQLDELIGNVMLSRDALFKQIAGDSRRDIDAECGFPKTVTAQMYKDMYDRSPVGARVVEVMPRECWQTTPTVYEVEDGQTATPFERAWDGLGRQLAATASAGIDGSGQSYHQDEKGSPVWEYLHRLDILSGIGAYGVLLLGIDDGKRPDQPAGYRKGRKLLYLRVFPQSLAQVVQYETDPSNARFGCPRVYQLTMNDPRESEMGGIGLTTATVNVHWSRVIHIAENPGSNENFGTPRMKEVYNDLLGLEKIVSAAPEGYWKSCFTGLSIESNPQLGGQVKVDRAGLKDMMEDYANGLQKWITLTGMTAKTLAPAVIDPTPFVDAIINVICIRLGIPVRVFKGSERGELASSQDDSAWNDRVAARRNNYVTPKVISPFVNRLVALGVLPLPTGFSVGWPDLTAASDDDKATVAQKRTAALAQYVAGGLEALFTPHDYLCRVMGFSEEEATAMLEASAVQVAAKPKWGRLAGG